MLTDVTFAVIAFAVAAFTVAVYPAAFPIALLESEKKEMNKLRPVTVL